MRHHNKQTALLLVALLALLAVISDAFVTPKPSVAVRANTDLPQFGMVPPPLEESFSSLLLLTDAESEAMEAALGPLRIFFGGIAAVVLLSVGLIFATGQFLVPAATQQLEKDTKRLRPGLWEEYEAKLKEGEQMVDRSDLLKELGDIMAPIIRADFDESARRGPITGDGDDGSSEASNESQSEK